jgi:hypothetical protein
MSVSSDSASGRPKSRAFVTHTGYRSRVSYFAQISDGQKAEANKNRYAIAKRSVFNSN